jgi:uncharacterized OB-fold protein
MRLKNDKAFKCKKCGRVTYPQRAVCLKCGSRNFDEIHFTEECDLLTFSQIYQLPWGINERFLTIGICKFDNGVKAMGRITTPDVKIGMRMKAYWQLFRQIEGEDVWGWIFEPVPDKR